MVTAVVFVLVAAGAAVVRLVVREAFGHLPLPWGTLAVNLAGSFALGVLVELDPPASTVLATAALGTLTTFSTFSAEVVTGWTDQRRWTIAYLVVSVAGGVVLAWLGIRLAT